LIAVTALEWSLSEDFYDRARANTAIIAESRAA